MSRIMSRPISIRAPPTAAEPAAFVLAWVAMARRKKAGLSSMRSSRPRTRARRRSVGAASTSITVAMVSNMESYIDWRQARSSSSRLAK